MPSLTLSRGPPSPRARPIAYVTGDGPARGRFLWLNEDGNRGASRIQLPAGNSFVLEPSHSPDERMLIGAFGQSGCGKSSMLGAIASRFHALHPRAPVALVSSLKSDSTLDAYPYIRRLSVQSLIERPIELEELRGALLLLDDCELLSREEEAAVARLKELVLTQGRHANVSMALAAHNPNTGAKDRTMWNELHAAILYPHGLSYHSLRYAAERYLGLSPDEIRALRRLPSRWVAVLKRYPTAIVYDSGAYLPTMQA